MPPKIQPHQSEKDVIYVSASIDSMLSVDLKKLARSMGIKGASTMKKAQLVEAIKAQGPPAAAQASQAPQIKVTQRTRTRRPAATEAKQTTPEKGAQEPVEQPAQKQAQESAQQPAQKSADQPAERPATKAADKPAEEKQAPEKPAEEQQAQDKQAQSQQQKPAKQQKQRKQKSKGQQQQDKQQDKQQPDKAQQTKGQTKSQAKSQQAKQQDKQPGKQQSKAPEKQQDKQQQQQQQQAQDDDGTSRRNRRRRSRDRDRTRQQPTGRYDNEPQVMDDDVLVPAAGILDVLDNYAFVRTSGYLPGPDDVYLSLSMVRKYALRRGDAVTGQVRQPREGERKEKFNPMVRIDSVNGADPDAARNRVDFAKLTPIHPEQRLRMETSSEELIGRVIDLVSPVGKGQRGLILAPSKAGRTTVLRTIANAVRANNPECHLMVVLLDERPEEVTDFERAVRGEVISSTFDRAPADHTVVAELALERAKRLVELKHDVVILIDGLTRLGRAYNLASQGSGRVLSGVDVSALHPPKKFFGAARNIENGGSLTILATARVESGSRTDEVIFEELEGTANLELSLRREYADQRLYPAVDIRGSVNRREDLLVGDREAAAVHRLLDQVSHDRDGQGALTELLAKLRGTRTNLELLAGVR